MTSAVFDLDMIASESALMAVAMIELDDGRHYNRQGPIGVRKLRHARVGNIKPAENRRTVPFRRLRMFCGSVASPCGRRRVSDAAGMLTEVSTAEFGSKERLVQEASTDALTLRSWKREKTDSQKPRGGSIFRGHRDAAERGVESWPDAA